MNGCKIPSPLSPRRPGSMGDSRSTRLSAKYGEFDEMAVFPGAFSPRKAVPYQRPRSAMYMSPRSEYKVDRQMTRTPEAMFTSRVHKTEKYREVGLTRWPPLAENLEVNTPNTFKRAEETLPLRRSVPNADSNHPAELWRRSLRNKGVPVSEPVYETVAGTVQLLHKEWAQAPRMPFGEKPMAYTGRSTDSRLATPRRKDDNRWVMRPVSTGQFALNHQDGKRYSFDMMPKKVPVQVGICHSTGGSL